MILKESDERKIVEALTHLLESQQQAEYDLCGEQREWHLPRLNKAASLFAQVFPVQAVTAMSRGKTPYGDLLCGDEP